MSELNRPTIEQLVHQFQGDLEQIGHDQIHGLPDLTADINHNAKYVHVRDSLEPGIYLDDHEEGEKGLYYPNAAFAFQRQPAHRLTREDSHNKVFFGRLWVIPEGSEASPEIHAQVAVKSMENTRKENLLGELALFQHLGRIGLSTFRPAALVISEQSSHLLTYFDGPVATMDTVEWEEMTPDEAWVELDKAVDTLVLLHTNMLFHGDLLFRNIAFNETGETVIIDPELMSSARDPFKVLENTPMLLSEEQQRVLNIIVLRMSHEFGNVCDSIDKHILSLYPKREKPRGDGAKLKLYKEYLFEPYKARIREAEEPVRSILLRAYDEMMAHKKTLAKSERLSKTN